jgi:hypothetical protein
MISIQVPKGDSTAELVNAQVVCPRGPWFKSGQGKNIFFVFFKGNQVGN